MLYVNYINDENMTLPDMYITIDNNKIKFATPEDGIIEKEFVSHEIYFIIKRLTKREDIQKNKNNFENIFFGDKRINIVSLKELNEIYNIDGYTNLVEILNSKKESPVIKRFARIQTGNMSRNVNSVITFYGNIDNIRIKSEGDVVYNEMDSNYIFSDNKEYSLLLWDSYSLSQNGIEYKSNSLENLVNPLDSKKEYIDFTIQKYRKYNFSEKANEEYDDDVIYIYSDAGRLDKEEVILDNGVSSFRLYLDGYVGEFTLEIRYNNRYIVNSYKFIVE